MKRIALCVPALAFVLILSSCRTGPMHFPNSDNRDRAILFGSIETSGALADIHLQYYEGSALVAGARAYRNGLWLAEDLKPGKYFLANFKADGYIHYVDSDSTNSFPRRLFSINPGEIRFAGSYKVVRNPTQGDTERITFNYIPVSSPSEQQLLHQLIEILKGTPWEKKIRKRLGELNKE